VRKDIFHTVFGFWIHLSLPQAKYSIPFYHLALGIPTREP
jgi:hypothetical protein